MAKIQFEKTELEGLMVITPFFAEDKRGYFLKTYEKEIYKEMGIETNVVETFESFSKQNVIRGLHYQSGQFAQEKLVRVLVGEVFDVCVDIRPNSKTCGKWFGMYLNDVNHKALYMERGFAHGFLVTSEYALMSYTCSGEYNQGAESGIRYDDKELNIQWPNVSGKIIQSERDAGLESFLEYLTRQGR